MWSNFFTGIFSDKLIVRSLKSISIINFKILKDHLSNKNFGSKSNAFLGYQLRFYEQSKIELY